MTEPDQSRVKGEDQMIAFLLQTALMTLVAYFAGAFLGCIVRRTFFAHTLETAVVNAARPAALAVPVSVAPQPAGITRFERALTGSVTEPATANPRALAPVAPSNLAPAAAAPVVARPVAPAIAPVSAPVSAPAPTPVPAPQAAAPSPAVAAASAAAAAAMAAVATARAQAATVAPVLPAAMGTSGPATVTAPIAPPPAPAPIARPVAAPAVVSAPVASPAPVAQAPLPASAPVKATQQDLTRIRAIDEQQQKQLNALGVGTFADIAAWRPEDVARIGAALKIPGRIEQENWIEQAQILAKGGETYYSRRKLKGELPTSRPTPDEGDRITVRVPAGTRPADDAPITAAPSAAPATATLAPVDLKAAAATAAGAVLAAQASVAPGIKAVAAAASPAAASPPLPPVVAVPAAQVLPAAPVAPIAVAPASPVSDRPIGTSRDALQRIAGINGEVERLLNVQGVTRYDQIAGWNATDVARFDRLLGFEGRVARENWIEQAQILSKGGETAYSRDMARRASEAASPAKLADAIQARPEQARPELARPEPERAAPREDLSALRSVRSEAYRAPESPGGIGPGAGRSPDDLKRIRGVGVLIEKKLNALGVTRYDQVANWSASDIERFSEKLDFKGRIERENWVEQARILSAGGQTEFSQRVDRGEVETSKPKA